MSSTTFRSIVLIAAALMLSGCAGTLDIWGISICVDGTAPPCDGTVDDDDDAIGPGLDLTVFDGVEWLNIGWTAEAIADGHFDCKEAWEAEGTEDSEVSSELCDVCDYIWLVTLTHAPQLGDEGCLLQGTDITIEQSYQRRVGLRDTGGGEFVMYRNEFRPRAPLGESADDDMRKIGVGAFRGADWTFAGEDTDITAVPGERYSFFFSGEGEF